MAQQITSEMLIKTLSAFDPELPEYVRLHAARFAKTITLLPRGPGRVLELGHDSHFSLAVSLLADLEVIPQNSTHPLAGGDTSTDPEFVFTPKAGGPARSFRRVLFNVEKDRFPFPDCSLDGVLCCELIEHLLHDPAAMLAEVHRTLKTDGWLMLTTPNLTSYHAIRKAVQGVHPLENSSYFNQEEFPNLPVQHTREYGFWDMVSLLNDCGFAVPGLWSFTFASQEQLGFAEWLALVPAFMLYNLLKLRHPRHLLARYRYPHAFYLARKAGPAKSRYPSPPYWRRSSMVRLSRQTLQ
jgi:SAM-dependent methyltransferase